MNQKKSSSEAPWMRNEMQALRSNEPDPSAIDQTVNRVLAYSSTPAMARPSIVWKAVPLAACLGAGAFFLFGTSQSASASSLQRVAEALKHQSVRHALTYRPGPTGELVKTNEDWIDGKRHAELYIDADGNKTLSGYDGRLMFVCSDKHGSFVDDMEPSGTPLEGIDSYLSIPGARVTKFVSGAKQDLYTVTFSDVVFNLYVNPTTRLPESREAMTRRGRLIEKNVYDYPAQIAPNTFKVPNMAGVTNYPALREDLARRVRQPGQTREVGGVRVSLKAVYYGKSRLLAVWTGGARGGADGDMWIEELGKPLAQGRPEAFTTSGKAAPMMVNGQQISGDGAWYPNLKLDGPFTVDVPAWAPAGGSQSKSVGRLKFRVTDAISVDDPDRILVKPSTEAKAVTGAAQATP